MWYRAARDGCCGPELPVELYRREDDRDGTNLSVTKAFSTNDRDDDEQHTLIRCLRHGRLRLSSQFEDLALRASVLAGAETRRFTLYSGQLVEMMVLDLD